MYIHEAVATALERNACIMRKSWNHVTSKPCDAAIKIWPTNTPDGCIVESVTINNLYSGWKPRAEDVTANDWITL